MSLNEEAAVWWVTLGAATCTDTEREEFFEWVNRSPERVEAFLWMVATHKALQSPEIQWPDTPVSALIAEATGARTASLRGPWSSRTGAMAHGNRRRVDFLGRSRRGPLALVFCAIVAIVGLWLSNSWFEISHRYDTGVGEQRSIVLSDGSVITLNTRSRIAVRFNRGTRNVVIDSGEALFQVAKDPRRAFVVSSAAAAIRAVGTEFNVRTSETGDVITVIEGKVEVSDNAHTFASGGQGEAVDRTATLAQGDQVLVTHGGIQTRERVGDLSSVTAWTHREIVLNGQTLSEVALEFNRYNERHLVIADLDLQKRRVSGVFAANDLESLEDFLRSIPLVEIRTLPNGDQVVERRSSGGP